MINTLNADYIERDKILFGEYDESKYVGGIRKFSCDRDTLELLVEKRFAEGRDFHNSAPSIREFLEYTEDDCAFITFTGYAVAPDRNDYRVSIDGVEVCFPIKDYSKLCFYVETFRLADDFSLDVIADFECRLKAWWD